MFSRLLLLLALCAPLSGCATMWLAAEVTDLNWSNSSYSEVYPGEEKEQSVAVRTRYVPPAPVAEEQWLPVAPAEAEAPVMEEAPEVEVVVEAPPPALLPPDGTLALACELRERPLKQHVVHHSFRYDGAWKPLTAFMFAAEALLIFAAVTNLNKPDLKPADRNIYLGMTAGLGLDALGTAVLFFHPTEEHIYEYDAPGSWASVGERCPADLAVRLDHTEATVAADGTLPGQLGRTALLAMATPGGAFDLRWRAGAVTVRPIRDARCAWAKAQGIADPSAFCQQPNLFQEPPIQFGLVHPEPYELMERPADAPLRVEGKSAATHVRPGG